MTVPLPRFRQPPGLDDPLPGSVPPGTSPPASPPDLQPQSLSDEAPRPEPLSPSDPPPRPGRRTRISSAGEREAASNLIRGLLVAITSAAAVLLRRRGLVLRQPSRAQLADIADPLGAIAARHLPLDGFSDDLLDAASATAAAHSYATDGPLIERIATAEETP